MNLPIKAINSRSKIKKSWNLEFLPFKIMKPGFYYTKNDAEKSIKILKILSEYIVTIFGPKMAIVILVTFSCGINSQVAEKNWIFDLCHDFLDY